jgi:hypothetical protein
MRLTPETDASCATVTASEVYFGGIEELHVRATYLSGENTQRLVR